MQRLSSEQLPRRDRMAIWREVFGREVFRIDIEAPPDSHFIADVTVQSLPGLKLLSGTLGVGVHARRTRELVGDGLCDLLFTVNRVGQISVSQRGQDRSLEAGDAALGSLGEVGGMFRRTEGESVSLQIPQAALAPLVPNLDGLMMQPIPRDRAALRLLIPYLDLMQQSGTLADSELGPSAVRHIYDLVILTIARSSDATESAKGRGARAARLATIKADIVANIARPDLSAEMIARRHGLSPRHVHRLFEQDDRSFAQFIMEMKLSCAYRMLTDPELSEWSIATIAEQAGFVERSHFNRALRLRYGASPSELRASVRRGEGG